MQTRILRTILFFSSVSLLSGCSLWQDEQTVEPEYQYITASQQGALIVPDGANEPRYGNDFAIPQLGDNAPINQLGDKLDIASPKLVLPLVTGSRVLEGSREAVVQFDKVNDSEALDTTIWNSLIGYLDERGIAVVEFDKDNQKLKTDWMVIEANQDSPWYSWNTTDRSIGQRFEFSLDMKPHGRSASLFVKLVDYLETINEDVIADISNDQVRRNEIEVLNHVISYYEKQLRIADVRIARRIQAGVALEMGFNADGDAAYLAAADYEVTWPRLLLVLRKLGFNVKDLDKSTGLIFVTYTGGDEGWWDSLFGDSEQLPIDAQDYRIYVREQGGKTSLTFKDEENNLLTASTISDMFPAFAEIMSTKDLDI